MAVANSDVLSLVARPEHQDAGEDERTRIDLVLVRIFGGGTMGGLENGMARVIVDVSAWSDADATDLSGECVQYVAPFRFIVAIMSNSLACDLPWVVVSCSCSSALLP